MSAAAAARASGARANSGVTLVPTIEVSETDRDVEIKAELPGMEPDDVEITVQNDLLTIKTNNGTFHKSSINPGAEALDDNTLELLRAVQSDTVDQFVLNHQDLVTKS